jgi:hypothetical protein
LSEPAKLTLDEAQNGEYVTTSEAARMRGLTISGIQNWRARGIGPQCFRVPGTKVNLYLREDVKQYVHIDGRRTRWLNRDDRPDRNPRQGELEDWLEENRQLVTCDDAEGED